VAVKTIAPAINPPLLSTELKAAIIQVLQPSIKDLHEEDIGGDASSCCSRKR
jgi:hypothetical protein